MSHQKVGKQHQLFWILTTNLDTSVKLIRCNGHSERETMSALFYMQDLRPRDWLATP